MMMMMMMMAEFLQSHDTFKGGNWTLMKVGFLLEWEDRTRQKIFLLGLLH